MGCTTSRRARENAQRLYIFRVPAGSFTLASCCKAVVIFLELNSKCTSLPQVQDPANSSQSPSHSLMPLPLSSLSFLDSVIHDGSSESPLYAIDAEDNITKVHTSDSKGFVNVSRVHWPTDFQISSFRKNRGLTTFEVVFGKDHWKHADELPSYSCDSLPRRVSPFFTAVQPIRLTRTILAIANSTSPITDIA